MESVIVTGYKGNFINRMTDDEIMNLLHRALAEAGFSCNGSNLLFQAEHTLDTLVCEVNRE